MKKLCKKLLVGILIMAMTLTGTNISFVSADTGKTVSITDIDYDKMTLTIAGDNDATFYFSDKNQKKWEKIPKIRTDAGGKAVMDISWISIARAYDLYIKGNVSTTPVKVTLPKYNSKFKALYDKANGTISYKEIPSGFMGKVQWRVKGFTEWNNTSANPDETEAQVLAEKLSYFVNEMSSTTVYFRTAPISGTSAESAGERPSKVSTVVIPKKSTAPSIKIDGTALTVKVPKGVQYRVVGSGNDWSVAKGSDENIELNDASKNMPVKAFYSESNPDPQDQIIEFRSEATSKNQVSASTFIRINAQEKAENAGLSNVTTTYLSGSSVKIDFEVPEDMKDNRYEYVITKPAEGSSEAAAPDKESKWLALQAKTEKENGTTKYIYTKSFLSDTLKEGYSLWIRRKTSGTAGKDDYRIASAPCEINKISYPNASSAGGIANNINVIKGTEYTSNVTLSYTVDAKISKDNTAVSAVRVAIASGASITLENKDNDAYNVSEPSETTNSDGSATRTYTVNITKEGMTALLANSRLVTDKEYTFYIDLASGESIKTNTTLEVLTATTIEGNKSFTKYEGFDKTLELTLNLGTKLAKDYDIKLSCDGKEITPSIAYVKSDGTTEEMDKATYAKCSFSIDDTGLNLNSLTKIIVSLYKKGSQAVAETVSGATVELKQPITVAQMGSTTFNRGNKSSDLKLNIKLANDESVTKGFSITDVLWKAASTDYPLKSGLEVNQTGSDIAVNISAKVLNSIPAGSSKLYVVFKAGEAGKEHTVEMDYVVTVNEASPEAPTTSDSSSQNNVNSVSSLSMRTVRVNKGAGSSDTQDSSGTPTPDADKVAFGGIDYNQLQMTINLNSNSMAFFSTNKKTWYAVDGIKEQTSNSVKMDISWMGTTKNYKLYLKGDKTTAQDAYVELEVPKAKPKFKAVFDKTSEAESPKLKITSLDAEVKSIQWRKYADYNWETINVNASSTNADEYSIPELEKLRVKGGKIVMRTAIQNGTAADDMGFRASNEVVVNIQKRAEAPNVKINAPKLKLNTTTAMEYYDGGKWVDCEKNMSVWDIPSVKSSVKASDSGVGSDISIDFRKKATGKYGYSKTITVVFKGQKVKPTFGEGASSDVTYEKVTETKNKKEVTYYKISFNKASSTNKYQYAIVKSGEKFDEMTAKWVTVSRNSAIKLSTTNSAKGNSIYVRTLGVNANTKLKTEATLPSAVNYYTIP